jgi:hypothetical protein
MIREIVVQKDSIEASDEYSILFTIRLTLLEIEIPR